MKKFCALILAVVLMLTMTSMAFAVSPSPVRFNISTDNTVNFQIGAANISKDGNYWHVSFNEETSNVTPTHRAVVRIHQGYNAISSKWVYEGQEYDQHPYKTNYTKPLSGVSFRARLDDRDSGILEFHGNFFHSDKR